MHKDSMHKGSMHKDSMHKRSMQAWLARGEHDSGQPLLDSYMLHCLSEGRHRREVLVGGRRKSFLNEAKEKQDISSFHKESIQRSTKLRYRGVPSTVASTLYVARIYAMELGTIKLFFASIKIYTLIN
jgi:hypothetical protein